MDNQSLWNMNICMRSSMQSYSFLLCNGYCAHTSSQKRNHLCVIISCTLTRGISINYFHLHAPQISFLKFRWELCGGKYFFLRSVNDIWPLFIEKYFLCIHLFFDSKELIKGPSMKDFSIQEVQHIIKHSNVHIGLLFKKSINGKKAFKKSLGDAFLGEMANHPSSKEPKVKKQKIA